MSRPSHGPTLIVGFDGSGEARDALVLAKQLAGIESAELRVAFVQDADDAAAERRFSKLLSEARRELGTTSFTGDAVADRDTARGLHDLAERLSAELIAVGSAHRGPVGRILLGSAGESLLHGAPCPVAVAPRGYADRERFGLGLIGVAYDGSPEADVALEAAQDLAGKLDCGLQLIGVVPKVGAAGRVAGTGPGYEAVLEEELTARLEAARKRLDPEIEASVVLEHGEPADALALHGVELDMLVIGSRGHGLALRTVLGSVSAKVMRLAPCPVLVTPRTADAAA